MSHSLDDEIQQFEALEKEFASNRHGIRVKFAYSLDEDGEQITSTRQTTVVKTEPFFHVQASEDQVTKHFYENEFPVESQPSPDSLEEEGPIDKVIELFESFENFSWGLEEEAEWIGSNLVVVAGKVDFKENAGLSISVAFVGEEESSNE